MKGKKALEPSGTVSRSCDLCTRRPAGALFGLVKEGAILRVLGINVPVNFTRRQVALTTTGTSAKRQASQPPLLGTVFRVGQRLHRELGSPHTRWDLPSGLRLEEPGSSSSLPIRDAPWRPSYPNDSRKSAPGGSSEARGGPVPPQTAYPRWGLHPTIPTSLVISNAFQIPFKRNSHWPREAP